MTHLYIYIICVFSAIEVTYTWCGRRQKHRHLLFQVKVTGRRPNTKHKESKCQHQWPGPALAIVQNCLLPPHLVSGFHVAVSLLCRDSVKCVLFAGGKKKGKLAESLEPLQGGLCAVSVTGQRRGWC